LLVLGLCASETTSVQAQKNEEDQSIERSIVNLLWTDTMRAERALLRAATKFR